MGVRVLPGEDPTTCVIRQETRLGAGYDYLETPLDPLSIAVLISDLSEQLARIHQLQRARSKD